MSITVSPPPTTTLAEAQGFSKRPERFTVFMNRVHSPAPGAPSAFSGYRGSTGPIELRRNICVVRVNVAATTC